MEKSEKSHSFYPPDFPCLGETNYLKIREMNFHYLSWGKPENPLVILLHGFLDHAHTFDLLASELKNDYYLVAWDARGFGSTDWVHPGGYYHFFEYIYDLHLFIEHFKQRKAILVGHSMGGMIASLYAGLFPENVEKLVNLEGWFISDSKFTDAPARARRWIEESKNLQPFKPLNDINDAAIRLQKNDPLMPESVAHHLAYEGTKIEKGALYWKHDPLHRTRSPQQTYLGQINAFWEKIECPVLMLKGDQSLSPELAGYEERQKVLKDSRFLEIKDAGHNLHLHQPRKISDVIRNFLTEPLKLVNN